MEGIAALLHGARDRQSPVSGMTASAVSELCHLKSKPGYGESIANNLGTGVIGDERLGAVSQDGLLTHICPCC